MRTERKTPQGAAKRTPPGRCNGHGYRYPGERFSVGCGHKKPHVVSRFAAVLS